MKQLVWTDDDGLEHVIELVALDPVAYAALVDACPPGPADPRGLPWSEETFPPLLIAECTGWSLEAASEFWDWETPDVAEELLAACLALSGPGGDFTWALRRLDADPRLVLEVEYCAGRGVAHDVFLGWSRRSQDLAVAWLVRSRDRCPGCGVRIRDMDDPGAADVELKSCVHCELREQMIGTIPAEHRGRVHAFVVPEG